MAQDGAMPVDASFLRSLLVPPPIDPDDQAQQFPDSILLDPFGFISPHKNDTTAEGKTRDGHHSIFVTFWPAKPPRISYFTVHCPGLPNHAFGDYPKIVTSEANLVLLRVPICRRGVHQHPHNSHYFVYKVGKNGPSLHLIPSDSDPDPRFTDSETVLLPRPSSNMYFIAKLGDRVPNGEHEQFNIHLFDSKKNTWDTKFMYASKDFNYVNSSKVITIGGPCGSVGWVDLWHGILICDVLQDSRYLRYIPLPSPSVSKVFNGPPTYVRDIVVVQRMHTFDRVDPESGYCVSDGWEAATSVLDPNKVHQNWKDDCTINISEITVTDPTHVQMLPNLLDGEDDTWPIQEGVNDAGIILKRLCAGCPSLSLQHNDVVYITNKFEFLDNKAWVIAVDMRHNALNDVAYYDVSGRHMSYGSAFLESGISKHLTVWSAARNRDGHNAAETRKNGMASTGKKKVVGSIGKKKT
ncbi:hypothetical protein EJB05_43875, partial [Eragrostis curvula]